MSEIMSPSAVQKRVGMTDGQIDKATDVLRASLRKHREEFKTDAAQQAITAKGLGADLLAVFRTHVERFSNFITRIVSVNRARTPEEALAATGRNQYTNAKVVAAMPRGTGEQVKVVFFKPDKSAYDKNGLISDDRLEVEFARVKAECGFEHFEPADPFSLCAVNESDRAFADTHPNVTHWKDANGRWYYVAFLHWDGGGRGVDVGRGGDGWSDSRWFAGLAS